MTWKPEGTDGEQDIGEVPTGDEPDGGNANRQKDARYDPAILFSEIKANDWRIGPDDGSIPNAEGLSHSAVDLSGTIRFFEPVPNKGHSNFAGDQGGAKAPWPVRLVKMSIEVDCPPTTGFAPLPDPAVAPFFVPAIFPPVGAVWADIIIRGRFSETLGDVPVLTSMPVSQIGGAGGATYDLGACLAGTGHNMVADRRNGFPRPDELILTPESGNGLKAWIRLNAADVPLLGVGNKEGKGIPGWGSPLAPGFIPEYTGSQGEPGEWKVTMVGMPFRAVKLNYYGQRGINIRAGKGSISSAVAKTR